MKTRGLVVGIGCCVALMAAGCEGAAPSGSASRAATDVASAAARLPSAEIVALHDDGTPLMVRGHLGSVDPSSLFDRAALQTVLAQLAPVFRVNAANLVHVRSTTDTLGFTHARFVQTKNGLPVVGGDLLLHLDTTGRVYAANGEARDDSADSNQAPAPTVSADVAVARAVAAETADEGTSLTSKAPRLVYFREHGAPLALTWEAEVSGKRGADPLRELVYVDATTGRVIDHAALIHSALTRAVYNDDGDQALPGPIARSEGDSLVQESTVDGSYDTIGGTYKCYQKLYARDSYDNQGSQLQSTVHYGDKYNNAFWNGSQMVYGDGDGVLLAGLATAFDVTSHELTHAVTQSTAALAYLNESGAINEGMSDIIATTCTSDKQGGPDEHTWLIGESVYTPAKPGDALRYMGDPTKDGKSTDYYPTRYQGWTDNGGVHWNSGIANLAFKLLVTGGPHPRGKTDVIVKGIGMDKAAQIFFRALTQYMTSSTDFKGARTATAQAATDLYDAGTVASVQQAWDAVGVDR